MRTWGFIAGIIAYAAIATALPPGSQLTDFGRIAWKKSAKPVRPGGVNGQPFWNNYAKRFIYAPAFDFKTVEGAAKYHFVVQSEKADKDYTFDADEPTTALSPVWTQLPVGYFEVTVSAVNNAGTSVGLVGKKRAWRAAPFNGPYHQPPVLPYDESAKKALAVLMHEPYVEHWLKTGKPDPTYTNYRYPSKICGALLVGAITQARLTTGTAEAVRAMKLAHTVADFMLKIRYPDNEVWAGHVPTYRAIGRVKFQDPKKSHMRVENHLITMGVDAGNAFLDLYDVTKEPKYLDAAKKIAETYKKTQQPDGTWPLFVSHATGNAVTPNMTIPTSIINYYDHLATGYGVTGLEPSKEKALAYVMNGPVKTWNWSGQFEDVKPRPAYENLSREQACELAMYLYRNKQNLDLADTLVRYAEDQFVIWEQPRPIKGKKTKNPQKRNTIGFASKTWITPSVQEQYVFWTPVGRSAGIMVDTYKTAYAATGDPVTLAKAQSIANSFTVVQREWHGEFPTFFTKYPMNLWLNSVVYPAKVLMELQSIK